MHTAVITCWYGPWPWYIPYFLHSCGFNKDIRFFIFTENSAAGLMVPANVSLVHTTMNQLKNKFSEKLGFKVCIDFPYKLCDFKPAYGFLFQEYLSNYQYWAHCDLDIIWGNMGSFLTDDFLSSYDYISLRHDYTTGCFSVYKNCQIVNELFMQSKDYRMVFASSEHYCFDECNFVWDDLTAGASIFELQTAIESFTHIVKRHEAAGALRCHFDFILMEGHTGKLVFDHGRIIYKRQFEAILYHLFWLKKFYTPSTPGHVPNVYYISPTRIYHKRAKGSTKK
jgi:hypothetical protein